MDAPIYSNVIIKLFTLLDLVLKNYVYNGYSTLTQHLEMPLAAAVTLSIALYGLMGSMGWRELSLKEFLKLTFKVALIYMFAMNWSTFSYYTVNGIEVAAGQIGNWLVSATPIPITLPTFSGTGINGALQSVLIEITKVGSWVWDRGSWHSFGPLFTAILIWLFGYAALVLAVIEILLAKMMLAILFTLAPLFISFTIFKPTHGMFERWLGAICGFLLFLVFIPAAITLGLTFMQWSIAGAYAQQALNMTLVGFVPVMIVGVLSVILILEVTKYAQNIGGGVSSSTGASLMAGAIGGVIGGGLTAMSIAKKPFDTASSLISNSNNSSNSNTSSDAPSDSPVMNGVHRQINQGES